MAGDTDTGFDARDRHLRRSVFQGTTDTVDDINSLRRLKGRARCMGQHPMARRACSIASTSRVTPCDQKSPLSAPPSDREAHSVPSSSATVGRTQGRGSLTFLSRFVGGRAKGVMNETLIADTMKEIKTSIPLRDSTVL